MDYEDPELATRSKVQTKPVFKPTKGSGKTKSSHSGHSVPVSNSWIELGPKSRIDLAGTGRLKHQGRIMVRAATYYYTFLV